MAKHTRRKTPVFDLEAIQKLRREVEKIPPQTSERAAKNLLRLKAAVERLETDAKQGDRARSRSTTALRRPSQDSE